jgi:Flp pilus assembly protein TadD
MPEAVSEHPLLDVKCAIAEARYRDALALLERVPADTADERAEVLVLEGESHEGLDDAAAASDAYARAEALAPAFPAPILRQGVLHYRRGDPERARRLLQRYVALETGNPEAYFYLARCEREAARKAVLVRRLVTLDGPSGSWSRALLGARGA